MIIISGHATVKVAVEAIRLGAYEFIEKPFTKEKIINYVNRGLESHCLKEKDIIENKLFHSFDLVGESQDIIKVKKIIDKLSTSESGINFRTNRFWKRVSLEKSTKIQREQRAFRYN